MDLSALFYISDTLIALGQDSIDDEINPIITYSTNKGDKWYVLSSSALLYSIAPSNNKDLGNWIGAGIGGLFYSDDLITWTLLEQVNGECWHIISSPSLKYYIAQCTNRPNVDAVSYDNIIMTSSNSGGDWDLFYSPCYKSHHETEQKEICNAAVYIKEWESFVLTSTATTGGIHSTMLDYFNVWHRAYFPYSVSFYGMEQGNERIVSLTQDSIFSGPLAALAFASSNPAIEYNQTRTSGSIPNYPSKGLIAEIPYGSSSDNSSGGSDDSDLGGGAVAGAVIGSIAGAILLVVLCIIIALVAFIIYNRTPKRSEENAAILNDEGL